MKNDNYLGFYRGLYVTAFIPYLSYIFPFIPSTIGGFNLTGWSWLLMLFIVFYYLLQDQSKKEFPIVFWIPWIVFLLLYVAVDFSKPGLQLTAQYILPILIGYVASGFTYNKERLHLIYKGFMNLSFIVLILFFYGQFLRQGYIAMSALTPMLLVVTAAVVAGLYFITGRIMFLVLFGVFFMVPVIGVNRMAIAAYLAVFLLHFANRKIITKVAAGIVVALAALAVFNSTGFQEKTFVEGQGKMSELSLNYYESGEGVNTSGRSSFMRYYEKGLAEAPLLGNGPRSDVELLKTQLSESAAVEVCNDYIAVRYCYGYIGLGLLLLAMMLTFMSLYMKYSVEKDNYRVLVQSTSMVLFIVMLMFMYSDNILKYTVFFPDLMFAMIGMSFAKYEA